MVPFTDDYKDYFIKECFKGCTNKEANFITKLFQVIVLVNFKLIVIN